MQKATKNEMDFGILEVALPLYTTAREKKIEACHMAVINNEDLNNVVDGKSESWVLQVVNDSRQLIEEGAKWLHGSDEEFLNIDFENLNDFSLAALITIATHRELDKKGNGAEIHEIGNKAMLKVLEPGPGSVLVDYAWMYQDAVGYDMYDNDDDHMNAQQQAIKHDLKYNGGNATTKLLGYLASDTIQMGETEKGVKMLATHKTTVKTIFRPIQKYQLDENTRP